MNSLGEPAVAFDSDCRDGICGACGIALARGSGARRDGPWWPRRTTRASGLLAPRRVEAVAKGIVLGSSARMNRVHMYAALAGRVVRRACGDPRRVG